jgi:hypothetical protein
MPHASGSSRHSASEAEACYQEEEGCEDLSALRAAGAQRLNSGAMRGFIAQRPLE